MELFDLNAAVHLDLSEIDTAIEKVNQLLALLQETKEKAGSLEFRQGMTENELLQYTRR